MSFAQIATRLAKKGVTSVVEKKGAPLFTSIRGLFHLSEVAPELQPLYEAASFTTQRRPSSLHEEIVSKSAIPLTKFHSLRKDAMQRVSDVWDRMDGRGFDPSVAKQIYPNMSNDEINLVKELHDSTSIPAMDNFIESRFVRGGGPKMDPPSQTAFRQSLGNARRPMHKPRFYGDGDYVVFAKKPLPDGSVEKFFNRQANSLDASLPIVDRAISEGFSPSAISVKPFREFILSEGHHLNPEMISDFVRKGIVSPDQGSSIVEQMFLRRGEGNWLMRENVAGYDKSVGGFTKALNDMVEGSIWSRARAEGYAKMSEAVRNLPAGPLQSVGAEQMKNVLSHRDVWAGPKQFMYGWALGANPGFWAQDSTQSFLTTLPEITKYVGVAKTIPIWTRGIKVGTDLVLAAFRKNLNPKSLPHINPEYITHFRRALNEGVVKGVRTEFLTGAHPAGAPLIKAKFKTALEQGITAIGNIAERGLRSSAFVSGLDVGKAAGLKGEDLYKFATHFVDATQFPYGASNRPLILNRWGPLADLASTFRHFGGNMMDRIVREVFGSREFTVAGHKFHRTLSGRLAQVATPLALAGASSIPGWQLYKGISSRYGTDPDVAIREWIKNAQFPEVFDRLLQNTLQSAGIHPDDVRDKFADVVTRGVPGMVGVDPSRWIALGQLPFSPYDDIFGVAQSMPTQAWTAIADVAKGRGWDEATRLLPTFLKGPATVLKWKAEGGVRAPDGEFVYTPKEWDRIMRALNIPSLNVSKQYEVRRAEASLVAWSKRESAEYAERIARARFEGNGALASAWISKMQEHNRGAPLHRRITVSPESIKNRIREMRSGRSIRQVPRRLRPRARKLRDMAGTGQPEGGVDR